MQQKRLPELLCPAGSPLALDAAIEGGADAVYLGGLGFNARMNASNFDYEALVDGIRRAHAYGVKVYLTLNTQVFDRELSDYLRAADMAQRAGADALIVADLGGASAIHRHLPDLALHASTQACAHSAASGEELARLGFSRMVVARELSLANLQSAVENAPIEIEAFIHGALCVCHSGGCLFSSLVGGRSGNRGECAQPCRLPYRTPKGRSDYPLSLKDLSLARHVPALIESGVSSLKIEGRMRSPEYVLTVARIWRRLLDEGRAASDDEMRLLADAFSRDGFTDGYFTGRIGHSMLGVRTDADKQAGRALDPFRGITRRLPLDMVLSMKAGQPSTLTVKTDTATFTTTGNVPAAAINAPLNEDTLRRQLAKLGNTPYEARTVSIDLDEGLMMPISSINDLRRSAIAGLQNATITSPSQERTVTYSPRYADNDRSTPPRRSACMTHVGQLTAAAQRYFDVCYLPSEQILALPIDRLTKIAEQTDLGVVLPPIIMDHERDDVAAQLAEIAKRGVRRALVGNIGHLSLVQNAGLIPDGDFRLNVTNSESVRVMQTLGIRTPVLSPELSLPQIRDIHGDIRTIVYGRIPLMLLEKCVIREIADCKTCDAGRATLTDRRGTVFPVLRTPDHRNVIYNSVPTYMADAKDTLSHYRVGNWHFIFSTETGAEVDAVVDAYEKGKTAPGAVRRINK
jgi:putative protease